MTDIETTHAPGCWSWGPKHYECALREIEALRAEVERLNRVLARIDRASVTGEDRSSASETGDWSIATKTGDWSIATKTGDWSIATKTGDWSVASVEGEHSVAIAPLQAEIERLRAEVERLNRILGRIVEGDGDSTTTIRAGTDAFAAAREYLLRDQED